MADVLHNARVNISGTGAHDQTLERGKTHGGIHALAADGCGNGCAVSEMADDHLGLLIAAAKRKRSVGNKVMGLAVEAVAADLIVLVVLERKSIHESLRLHAHTESGIEYADIRLAGHNRLACLDAENVCRVVKRCQVGILDQSFLDFFVDQNRLCELLSAMDHSVADRIDLVKRLDHTVLRINKLSHNKLYCSLMILHLFLDNDILMSRNLVGQLGALNTDTLYKAFAQDILCVHVNDLILQG